jgi:hypothetical protein
VDMDGKGDLWLVGKQHYDGVTGTKNGVGHVYYVIDPTRTSVSPAIKVNNPVGSVQPRTKAQYQEALAKANLAQW